MSIHQQHSARYERLSVDGGGGGRDAEAADKIEHHGGSGSQLDQGDNYYMNGHGVRNDRASVGVGFPKSARFMHLDIYTQATILFYLLLSISLTFYQKHLLHDYKFPLTITLYHLILKLSLAASLRTFYKWRWGKSRVRLDWNAAWRSMAPTGIASGIDIGFSMWGLGLVGMSLYTMTKSTTIIFIMIFAILLGLEKKSWSLVLIVVLISSGLFMLTYKSTAFHLQGFIFLLVASLSSGIRWSLAQFLIQKTQLGLHNPIDMIFYMQPWMIATLIPISLGCEGNRLYSQILLISQTESKVLWGIFLKVTFGAVLAFLMEIGEFLVLSKTSSLTLSIAGIVKEICQLALAFIFLGDSFSAINLFGIFVCLTGIFCHLAHKYTLLVKMERLQFNDDETPENSHLASTNEGLTSSGGNAILGIKQHSAQSVPLLGQSDSYDSDELEDEEPNASDVIFDVLKRRDM